MRALVTPCRASALTVAVGLLLILPTGAFAFTGLLSGATSGILGGGNWLQDPIQLSWDVHQNADQSWHYSYVFSHAGLATSHLLFETSADLASQDIFHAVGDFASMSVGPFGAGGSHPYMPTNLYGIQFDGISGVATSISFDSWRTPMWGDFYAKDSNAFGYGQNYAYNAGFVSNLEQNLSNPIGNGALGSHLLVPSAQMVTPVPEPSSMLLLGTGLLGFGLFQKRRRS